jgi:E3 ubiquitin-protein ligase synoviolin
VLETGAARPQPGAVPQAPNNGLQAPPPFANNANRRPNNQNRIRRAMDILLGAAAQPPMVPGQFANGPLPARFAGPDAAGGHVPPGPRAPPVPGAQRAPALVFEYNYVWDPNTRAPILMQPPMLQGFYREDGLWQGWPGGLQQLPPGTPGAGPGQVPATPAVQAPTPEALNNGPVSQPPSQPSPGATPVPNAGWQAVATNTTASQAMAPPTSENSTPARSSTRDAAALAALRRSGITSPNVPSPLSRSPSMTGSSDGGGLSPQDGVPPPASSTSTSTPSSGSATGPSSFTNGPGMNQTPTPVSRPATPRDAAAMAALRRFGGPATPIMSPSSSQPVASGQPMQASSSSPANVQDSMSAPPTPTRTTQAPTPQRVALPSLIPLYDFGRPMPRLAQRPPQGGGFIMPPLPPPSPPNGSITNLIPPDHPHYPFVQARAAGMATPGMMTPTLSFPAQPRTPLASLPTTITDEQLQRLDGTTREAIDERIKVLEDVGAAVDRCTEELLRLRSVLPSASSPIAPSPTSSSWPPPTDKGKGVDPSERSSQPSLSVPPTQESRLPSTLTSTTSLAPTAPTPVSTSAAAPRQASLAATVASQMTALGALATTHPTQAQVPVLRLPVNSNPVAASADVTLPPEPTLNTESGAVPLAVADPTLEQAAAQNLEGERVLPNIGGQVVSSEEESESEEEDSE